MDTEKIINIWKSNGFVGIKKLKTILTEHNIQISNKELSDLIKDQKTNKIHKVYKSNQKSMGHIISYAKNHNWQMDLSDMSMYQTKNHGYKYILLAVDVFTRKAYAQAIKNKTEKSITEAFNKMTQSEQPLKLTTDNGSEFINKEFKVSIDDKDINHVTTSVGNHNALGIIDRFTRTLKEMIHKHFTENNTTNWVDVLQTTINIYNNNPHDGINEIKPNEAENKKDIIMELNIMKSQEENTQETNNEFKIGDKVRVRENGTFRKGYLPKWSFETHTITNLFKVTAILSDGKKYKLSELQHANEINTVDFNKPVELYETISEHKAKKNFEKEGLNKKDIVKGTRKKNKVEHFQA